MQCLQKEHGRFLCGRFISSAIGGRQPEGGDASWRWSTGNWFFYPGEVRLLQAEDGWLYFHHAKDEDSVKGGRVVRVERVRVVDAKEENRIAFEYVERPEGIGQSWRGQERQGEQFLTRPSLTSRDEAICLFPLRARTRRRQREGAIAGAKGLLDLL
jgi:hypothetical protein